MLAACHCADQRRSLARGSATSGALPPAAAARASAGTSDASPLDPPSVGLPAAPGDEYCVSWAATNSDAADVVASVPDMATVQQQVQRAQQLHRAPASLTRGVEKEFYNKTPSHDTGHGTGAHWH